MAAFRLYAACSACIISLCVGFNLDTDIPIIKNGPPKSYFGYSVAQHWITDEYDGSVSAYLIIGAPRGNVSQGDGSVLPEVLDINSPGVVYSCPLSANSDDCTQIALDRDGLRQHENKSDMWLGVSVASQGTPDGLAIACAHRYRKVSPSFCHGFGMCLSMNNALDELQFWNPCESKEKGHEYYGYCQSGTSVDLAEDGELLIGLPGPFVWRGAVMKNIIQDDFFSDSSNPMIQDEVWSPVEPLKQGQVGPQPATDYYAYLGSSTKIGRVLGGQMTYISGAPRSNDSGQVLLFTEGSELLEVAETHYLNGYQFGSNFGHEIAIVDFNNDGKNDLVISAPFYLDKNVGGAIYVYMNSEGGISNSTDPIKIYSREMGQTECKLLHCEDARFGFSLASLGDVDLDGFEDLAVGAPYEGNGAIYIFRGSADGILPEYSQRIYADDLRAASPLQTFGYSLSGGMDMDKSSYPDLIVGAYNSDKVISLRSRPVINILASILTVEDLIRPGRCRITGLSDSCFQLRTCYSYLAEPAARFQDPLPIKYRIEAEKFTGSLLSRVYFEESVGAESHVIEKHMEAFPVGRTSCVTDTVFIQPSTKDFLNPISFKLTYKLVDIETPVMLPNQPLPDINTYPIIHPDKSSKVYLAEFEKKCGTDNVCHSSLHLGATFKLNVDDQDEYVLRDGELTTLELDIVVTNHNEAAHETTLTIDLPSSVYYSDVSTDAVKCTPVDDGVMCLVANPLEKDQVRSFTLLLQPTTVQAGMSTMTFKLALNTTSIEESPDDNYKTLEVRVIVQTDLLIRGQSVPSDVEFSGEVIGESAVNTAQDIGSSVVHTYEVINSGSGTVPNASVFIKWPYELNNTKYDQGKHVLYLLGYPEVQPYAPCYLLNHDPNKVINPLGIKVNSTFPADIPYLEAVSDGVQVSQAESASRVKRDSPQPITTANIANLDCDSYSVRCLTFRCDVGTLEADRSKSVVIAMRSRLWDSTFIEEFLHVDKVHIFSKAWISVPASLNVKQDNILNDAVKVRTVAQPALVAQAPKEVPLWVIIVSALAGVIVLLLIVLLLWKCGFFKRTTQDEMKKHQAEVKKSDFGYD